MEEQGEVLQRAGVDIMSELYLPLTHIVPIFTLKVEGGVMGEKDDLKDVGVEMVVEEDDVGGLETTGGGEIPKKDEMEAKFVESKISVLRTIPVTSMLSGLPEEEERTIEVHKFVTTPAEVELTYGKKLQIEKFEPVEVRVTVRMPCYKEEVKECYSFIQSLVTDVMNREISTLIERKKEKIEGKEPVHESAKGKRDSDASEKSFY
ncbi:MAG: hypothetical protein HQK96_01465 [Nitrospirae bacterium]|nr:hypothetical protein [Nitrospirota bacterium]